MSADKKLKGSYIHPSLIIDVASWLSLTFKFTMMDIAQKYIYKQVEIKKNNTSDENNETNSDETSSDETSSDEISSDKSDNKK